MANWARNSVTFQGKKNMIEEINDMFVKMIKEEEQTKNGQLPIFMKYSKGECFFSTSIVEKNNESLDIFYETKWYPNLSVLIEIANQFNVNFKVLYQELGHSIFGKATFLSGNLEANIYELDEDDFEKFEYLEEENLYLYNNEGWKCYNEMLEAIFEEKFISPLVNK